MVNVASLKRKNCVCIRTSLRTDGELSLLELLDLRLYRSTERRAEKLPVFLAIDEPSVRMMWKHRVVP